MLVITASPLADMLAELCYSAMVKYVTASGAPPPVWCATENFPPESPDRCFSFSLVVAG